jgi:hypothetical protein
MRLWTSLTSHFHTHAHHNRVNSQTSELSEIAKGKQPENVEVPDVEKDMEGRKTVQFKKGGRAKGGRLLKKQRERGGVNGERSGEMGKSIDG